MVILVLGLFPALQRTLICDAEFHTGSVNRTHLENESVGGKGQGCARAIHSIAPGDEMLVQFVGGWEGMEIQRMLDEVSVRQISIPVDARTRRCTTVISRRHSGTYSGGVVTEIVEESPAGCSNRDALLVVENVRFEAVALCGSAPVMPRELTEDNVYGSLVHRARREGSFVLVDVPRRILFESAAIGGIIDVLKINRDELVEFGESKCLEDAAARLLRHCRWIAVTRGGEPALLFSKTDPVMKLVLPELGSVLEEVPDVLFPIGSGDTCSGVMLVYIVAEKRRKGEIRTADVLVAFRRGLAAAMASLLANSNACFDRAIADCFFERIIVSSARAPDLS